MMELLRKRWHEAGISASHLGWMQQCSGVLVALRRERVARSPDDGASQQKQSCKLPVFDAVPVECRRAINAAAPEF